jgi:hypothetical protein
VEESTLLKPPMPLNQHHPNQTALELQEDNPPLLSTTKLTTPVVHPTPAA